MIQAIRPIPQLSDSDKERFFSKIPHRQTEKGCIEWMAGKFTEGYGQFCIHRRSFMSHRVAYFLATGVDPRDLCVCHTCDNPPCVNPDHLFLGTNADNMRDKIAKGRANNPSGHRHGSRTCPGCMPSGDQHYARINPEIRARGEKNANAKLKATDIPIIRADTRKPNMIAADYGVSAASICLIQRRKTWVHVE